MHDCFAIELTGECLKCFIRLTRGVPAVVVQSEALWARIPEIQVRIPSRAMGTFFPSYRQLYLSSFFDTHTHTHTHTLSHLHCILARTTSHVRNLPEACTCQYNRQRLRSSGKLTVVVTQAEAVWSLRSRPPWSFQGEEDHSCQSDRNDKISGRWNSKTEAAPWQEYICTGNNT